MMCPGQDTRYWKPDDVFDVACEACGHLVEFFKVDASRPCPACGKRIQNPKVSMGCAKWCAYAKQCLGFDPRELELPESGELSAVDRLVAALKAELAEDQRLVAHSLRVLDRAREIMQFEGGDPGVVTAAALLHDVGSLAAGRKHGSSDPRFHEVEGSPIARRVMEEAGFDEAIIARVCDIVRSHHSAGMDSLEFRIVWDADRLEEVPEGIGRLGRDRLTGIVDRVFRTDTGKAKAFKRYAGA